MSKVNELVCPSGLRVKLRSLKGKDLDTLTDNRRVATGEAITTLLDDCTIELIDRSIYVNQAKFTWHNTLVGDRLAALIGIRTATHGDEYSFRVRCTDSDCRAMIDWSLELSELPTRSLSEASREIFLRDNRFPLEGCGRKLTVKLITGADQLALAKLVEKLGKSKTSRSTSGRALLGLSRRIVEVEGITDVLGWLEDQDLQDIRALVKAIDEVDCGIETGIEIVCPECALQQEVDLPLDKRFFAPDN